MRAEQARLYGIDPMKVRIEKEIGNELSLDEEQELLKNETKKITVPQNNDTKPYTSKIVTEEELPHYVGEGWDIAKELSNGRFLIRKSNNVGQH